MRDQAEVVIIGGGIFGTSVAYHLAKAGCFAISHISCPYEGDELYY